MGPEGLCCLGYISCDGSERLPLDPVCEETDNPGGQCRRLLKQRDESFGNCGGAGHQLVADCDVASFEKGQQDVVDPEYREAGKLDPRNFASSFHPTDLGILENVEQILLPSISTDIQNRLPFRKLSAELYKLNVCQR